MRISVGGKHLSTSHVKIRRDAMSCVCEESLTWIVSLEEQLAMEVTICYFKRLKIVSIKAHELRWRSRSVEQ